MVRRGTHVLLPAERHASLASSYLPELERYCRDLACAASARPDCSGCAGTAPPPTSVAYLGPAGTFSQAAAQAWFGERAVYVPCETHEDVFRKTETGATDYSVVPMVNTIGGAVTRNQELAASTGLRRFGAIDYLVRQNLLRQIPTLDGVRRVYSHRQSFLQTRLWLGANLPRAERIEVSSNAEAARLAAGDAAAVAIAGLLAARRYGLLVLRPDIQDLEANWTLFVVFSRVIPNGGGVRKIFTDSVKRALSQDIHPIHGSHLVVTS